MKLQAVCLQPGRIALLLALIFFSAQAAAAEVSTWILAGQSNAEGYAITESPVPGLLPADTLASIGRSDLNQTHSKVRMYQGSNGYNSVATSAGLAMAPKNTWHAMTPYEGLAYNWGDGRGNESGRRFGPELSFGYLMQARTPDEEIAIIKFAAGSASIASTTDQSGGTYNDYDPSDSRPNRYDQFIATIQSAVDNLPAGDVLKIEGVLWMQGEGDANANMSADYEANLTEFISSLRVELATISNSSGGKLVPALSWNETPFFASLVASGSTPQDLQNVHDGVLAVSAADPNVYAVNAVEGLSWLTVDDWNMAGLHYDTQGQVKLGERFAQAVITGLTEDAYSSWKDATFSNPSGPNTERPGDFDGDGYSNEFEYFLGMDPEDAGNQAPNKQAVSASTVTASDDYLAITFTYRTDTPDIRYAVRASTNLTTNLNDWTDETASMIQVGSITDNADGTATQTLRYPSDITTVPKLFLQVVATESD